MPGPKWYRWWDFGNGTMSDLGSHWVDLPFWALKLQVARTVEAFGPPPHPEIAPASMHVDLRVRTARRPAPVAADLVSGRGQARALAIGRDPEVGERRPLRRGQGHAAGRLRPAHPPARGRLPRLQTPGAVHPAVARPPRRVDSRLQDRAPTTCNFEYAGWLTEANHLGNVAYRAGKKLEWDAVKLHASNAPEAARLLRREYRKGWTLG